MLRKEFLKTARSILRAAQTRANASRVSLRRLLRTISSELRKPRFVAVRIRTESVAVGELRCLGRMDKGFPFNVYENST
jgi:hypothetical protein